MPDSTASFHDWYVALFHEQYPRLCRVLGRLSGESELAADLAQEAFLRLYRRGEPPEAPTAWLVSVGLNLARNELARRRRRFRLLTPARGEAAHSDPGEAPDSAVLADEARRRVRSTLDEMSERDRGLLLLRAEGYSYQEMASVLELKAASVGTLLARAQRAFRTRYQAVTNAS